MSAEKLFRDNPLKRKAWEDVLNMPITQEVLSLLWKKTIPRQVLSAQAGVPFDTTYAHHYERLHGKASILDSLESFSKEYPLDGSVEEEQEFDHVIPESHHQARARQQSQP